MRDNSILCRTGRVWLFGNNINTDLIFPGFAFRAPLAEQHKHVFSANRPEWIEQVREGDIIVAGTDFGMGSGRPIGSLLHACGIRGILAESVNGLGFRNCVNYGMPIMACRGISALFAEGDIARISFATGNIENMTTGGAMKGPALPNLLADITAAGGILQMLVAKNLVDPEPTLASSK